LSRSAKARIARFAERVGQQRPSSARKASGLPIRRPHEMRRPTGLDGHEPQLRQGLHRQPRAPVRRQVVADRDEVGRKEVGDLLGHHLARQGRAPGSSSSERFVIDVLTVPSPACRGGRRRWPG
jgi:hypothetical protein